MKPTLSSPSTHSAPTVICSSVSKVLTRQNNTQKRHERIRAAYKKRYTDQPRPRLYTREYILSQLADEFCLSMATVEGIIWTKAEEAKAA